MKNQRLWVAPFTKNLLSILLISLMPVVSYNAYDQEGLPHVWVDPLPPPTDVHSDLPLVIFIDPKTHSIVHSPH